MMEVTETTDQEEMVMICQIPAKIEGSRVTNYQEMETTIGSRQFSFINQGENKVLGPAIALSTFSFIGFKNDIICIPTSQVNLDNVRHMNHACFLWFLAEHSNFYSNICNFEII